MTIPIAASRRITVACSAVACALALCVLAGWAFDVPLLRMFVPGTVTMKANTAICMLLLAAGLIFRMRAPAAAAGALAIAVLAQWLLGVDLGVDQALFREGETAIGTPDPGRMAPNTCVCLLLIAVAARVRGDTRGRRVAGSSAALGAMFVAFAALVGYALDVPTLFGLPGVTQMAVPTAAGVLLLASASIVADPRTALMRLLLSSAHGGHLFRRLLPVAVGVPLAADIVRIVATNGGLLPERTADWLFLVCVVVVLVGVSVRLSWRLDLADRARLAGDGRVRASEALARAVTDGANDAILANDDRGIVTLFNPAAARLFGWEAGDVLGQPVQILLPEHFRGGHARWVAEHARDRRATLRGSTVEMRGRTRDGRDIDIEVSFAATHLDEGLGFMAIVRDITTRKRVQEGVRADAERFARLVDAQTAIGAATGGIADVMGVVAERACEVVGGDGAVVELPEGDELVYRAVVGSIGPSLGMRISIAQSLSGLALRTAATLHCRDSQEDPRVDGEALGRMGVRSMICVPLRHEHQVLGVLKVVSGVPDAFSEPDERTLELLTGLGGAAVHRAQADRRLAALHTVSRAVAEATSLAGGLSSVLRGVGETLEWELMALWLAPEDGAALECQEVWHAAEVPAAPYARACGATSPGRRDGILGEVWHTCRASWIEDLQAVVAAPADRARAAAAADCGLRTVVHLPVVAGGEALGVLELGARESRGLDTSQLELLAVVGGQIGQFVQRQRAQGRIAAQAADLRSVVELAQAIGRLQNAADVRPTLCAAVREITDADQVTIAEPDADGRLAVTAQVGDRLQEGYAVSIEESVVGAVYRAGVGRYVNDLLDDGEAHGDATRRSGLRSAYVEPLLRDGEPAGVLAISWHTVKRADPSKLSSLVGLLATETASAIERADLVSELASTARTDQLTGVRNRRAWDEELPRELARARRVGAPVCVAMIDIDHFKAYNDRHGHLAGDRLLRTAAAGWSRRLRTTDLMARYGGEEFCVLLPGCSEEIGERLLDLLRRDMPDRATCSAGVAEWDGHESPEELVGRADRALYAAKRGGRDRVATAGATAIRQPA